MQTVSLGNKLYEMLDFFLLCWGLTTCQPLWVILSHLPEKRRREIDKIVEKMKERDRGERQK